MAGVDAAPQAQRKESRCLLEKFSDSFNHGSSYSLDRGEVDFELICKLWKVLELPNNDDSATSKYLTLLFSIEGLPQR